MSYQANSRAYADNFQSGQLWSDLIVGVSRYFRITVMTLLRRTIG